MSDRGEKIKDIIVRHDSLPQTKDKGNDSLIITGADKVKIAQDSIKVVDKVVDLAGLYIGGQVMLKNREEDRKMVRVEIEKIDAEAGAACRKLEAEMSKIRDKTERLRIICEFLKDRECPDEAINNIIINFSD